MKYLNLQPKTNTLVLGLLVILMITLTLCSCARKVSFLTSSVVPAARGSVKVTKDSNKNYVIKIDLDNLAEVNRLTPPKQTYVVWMLNDEYITKNIGQIKSSTSLMSSKLKANFETVSSSKPIKIFITAEDIGSVLYPGTQVVISTDSF